MKRMTSFMAIAICMAVCISLIPSKAISEDRPKVLLIPREGFSADLEYMLWKEVWAMTLMLMKAGFKVEVATASGMLIISPGRDLKPDLRLDEVKVADYVGFIMPCMAVGGIPGPPIAPEAVAMVKQAVAEGKPVAAQFGSVIILAQAGILKGKKYAMFWDPLKPNPFRKHTDPRFADAIYSGRGVVQDGNIITSGTCPYLARVFGAPDGTSELTQTFIAELKKK
jgi:putative intracellular protease/amidase